ncbi:unnamed protein product, partial [Rotaria sordida]
FHSTTYQNVGINLKYKRLFLLCRFNSTIYRNSDSTTDRNVRLNSFFKCQLLRGTLAAEVFSAFQARLGDVYQFWFGPSRFIVISGIGAQFTRHASITIPLFRRAKIIYNVDLIVDCTDKLLATWRAQPIEHIHCDILQQRQNLVLQIFGLISFDYDLNTLNGSRDNELTKALQNLLSTSEIILFSPNFFDTIYSKVSRRHRQAKAISERYIYLMIEQELAESPESRAHRKRTSLIASLVASLQQDEAEQAKKSEEENPGPSFRPPNIAGTGRKMREKSPYLAGKHRK